MRCPFCGHDETQVKDSRPSEDNSAIRRRRQCPACGARFTTFERVQLRELMVIKKDESRVVFDREKLVRSINISCRKRPVKPDQIGFALDDIIIQGAGPIVVTESPANTFTIDSEYATTTDAGSVRFATDLQASTGTATDVAITPAQITSSIAAIPYATRSTPGIVRLATPAEAVAGTANNVAVTPDQLDAKVDEVDVTADLPLVVVADPAAKDFHFSINAATELAMGAIRIATSAEVTDGTSTTTCITPAQLANRLGGFVITDASKTEKGIIMLAQFSDVAGGTEDTKAVTAAGMRYALDQPDYLLDAGTY